MFSNENVTARVKIAASRSLKPHLHEQVFLDKFSLIRKNWQFFVIYTSKFSLTRKNWRCFCRLPCQGKLVKENLLVLSLVKHTLVNLSTKNKNDFFNPRKDVLFIAMIIMPMGSKIILRKEYNGEKHLTVLRGLY